MAVCHVLFCFWNSLQNLLEDELTFSAPSLQDPGDELGCEAKTVLSKRP